ncbi:MAG: hypothetical protein QM804_07585 [Propionicimonas sp.]
MAGSRREGIHGKNAGTVDAQGFIAPSVGLVDHALYFTAAPDVLAKTRQVLDEGRLELPGAVIVWDETIGRRKGAKAVPGSWWATSGSVTMTLVFASDAVDGTSLRELAADGVLAAIDSFTPDSPASYDGDGGFVLAGKHLGMIGHEVHGDAEILIVRVNAVTDFDKAPPAVRDGHSRLIEVIDESSLPLGKASTLPNQLSLAIMREVPARLLA